MSNKKCEEQLNSLIEHFNSGGLDFDATDIEAIKHLLLENQMQQDTIKKTQNNWNELKKWIEAYKELCNWCDKELLLSFNKQEIKCCQRILYKMQELEESDIK